MGLRYRIEAAPEARWRRAGYRSFFGVLMVAADTFLEWRGPSRLLPWQGGASIHNLGYLGGAILLPGAIGLALGWWTDSRRLRRSAPLNRSLDQ